MNVLGIETSCDETSAAVVENGRRVFSNVVSSQLDLHRRFGGVVPEIASRAHLESIDNIVKAALEDAGKNIDEISGVAVTRGPGLIGALLVGISYAEGLSEARKIPLAGVNHLHAHLYANMMSNQKIKMPFVGLLVSGGHTILCIVEDVGKYNFLGTTVDDAAGEAFDKIAKLLELGYPGGPVIEKAAEKGDPNFVRFPRARVKKSPYFFSFSGLKTAVLYYVKKTKTLSRHIEDVAASFQEAVVDSLIEKSLAAADDCKIKRLVVGGGVSCNRRLREKLCSSGKKQGIEVFFPSLELCTDNAAMIAGIGFELLKKGKCGSFNPDPNLKL